MRLRTFLEYLGLGLILVIPSTLVFWWADLVHESSPNEPWGTFGDSFAPIIGLFTSLALGAAIISTLLQRRELALQRQAMTDQKGEMAKQADAMQQLAAATYAQFGATMNQSFVNLQIAKLRVQDELRALVNSIDDMFSRKWKREDEREQNVMRLIKVAADQVESASHVLKNNSEAKALIQGVDQGSVLPLIVRAARLVKQVEELDETAHTLLDFQRSVTDARNKATKGKDPRSGSPAEAVAESTGAAAE